MIIKIHFPLAALLLVIPVLTGVSCAPGKAATVAATIPKADNSSSAALFKDVNSYRARLGLPPLVRHEGLDRLALNHSEFLRKNRGKFQLSKTGNVSHLGFDGRAAVARTKYGIPNLHENVAAGPRGTSIVRVWASSKGHEPAMREKWAYTGVGVVVDSDGMIFATQLFGSQSYSHMALRQTFGSW